MYKSWNVILNIFRVFSHVLSLIRETLVNYNKRKGRRYTKSESGKGEGRKKGKKEGKPKFW